jgi:hypothetical protein
MVVDDRVPTKGMDSGSILRPVLFFFPSFFGCSFGPAEDGHANKGVWEQRWERLSSPVSRIHLEEDSAHAQVRALEILVQTRTRAMCAQISIAEAREKWKAS